MQPTLHTLPNGMQLYLEEHRSAPVISFNVLVRVGSAMETDSEAGISHFIEHMLFKGTPTRAVGQIASDVEGAGGDINAYTSFDQTVYYINMASRYADQGLDILADAVQHPIFDAEETIRESEVICEEIRRGDDNPTHALSERVFEHCYGKQHRYGRPIIGYHTTVKSFRDHHLRDYWNRWYTAPNTCLVVVGDFDTDQLIPRVEAAFADMHRTPPPIPADVRTMPNGQRARVHHHRADIQNSYFALGAVIPEITHQDIPALDVLDFLLGEGDSSRLEQEVKERQRLVQSIYSYVFSARGCGLFAVGGTTNTGKMEKTLPAIWQVVDRFQQSPVSTSDIERAKLNIQSNRLYEQETVAGQAGKHVYFLATAGDPHFEENYHRAIATISADQIQDVAQKYLHPDRTILTWLAPKGDRLPSIASTAKSMRAPKRAIKKTRRADGPTMVTLPNGMRCIVRSSHRLPLISCQAVMLGGTRMESTRTNGVNTLLARTITKGTLRRDQADIAEACDAMAGSINASTGRNSFGLRADFLSAKINDGFALLGEVLFEPSFAADEVAKEKTLQIESIRNLDDNLAALASIHFNRAMYGQHPYALPQLGTKQSVRSLAAKDLHAYYARIAHPENMVLSIAGDIDADAVQHLADRYLTWPRPRKAAALKVPALDPITPDVITIRRKGKEQAHLLFGMRAISVNSKDRYGFAVLNQILAGHGGRLFLHLRDQLSLAYSVNAYLQLGIETGYFAVYIGTEPSKVETAIDAFKEELHLMASKPVGRDELDRIKRYLVGTYELELQRNGSVAGMHAYNVLYGLGVEEGARYPEKILKITADDILRIAKKYLRTDRAVCAIVTP